MKELLVIIVILLLYISLKVTLKSQETPALSKDEGVVKKAKKSKKAKKHKRFEMESDDESEPEQIIQVISPSVPSTNPPVVISSAVPINVPTRGEREEYRQLGVLTDSSNAMILPLFGRRLWSSSNKLQYFTKTDKFHSLSLPVFKNGRDCSETYGCDEIYEGDEVYVPQLGETFSVTLYHLESPRYIPFI
tara:strand:+ start:2023 stop:2595 length:573 start_codon:yes stop_codon:yes gene_type:complete